MGETVNWEMCIGNINLHIRLVLEGMERGMVYPGNSKSGDGKFRCNCTTV